MNIILYKLKKTSIEFTFAFSNNHIKETQPNFTCTFLLRTHLVLFLVFKMVNNISYQTNVKLIYSYDIFLRRINSITMIYSQGKSKRVK